MTYIVEAIDYDGRYCSTFDEPYDADETAIFRDALAIIKRECGGIAKVLRARVTNLEGICVISIR